MVTCSLCAGTRGNRVPVRAKCTSCRNGTVVVDGQQGTCGTCSGNGWVETETWVNCGQCNGSGQVTGTNP